MQTARLDEIVRQKDPALKGAVEQLARGEVQEAIDNLDRRGCVHEIVGRNERLTEIARDYAREPHGTLSSDNESRRQLNGLIHRAMQERGDVSQYEDKVRILDSRQEMTGADRQWAGQYEEGDVVRYTRGSPALGIGLVNMRAWKQVDAPENRLTIDRENGEHRSYAPLEGTLAFCRVYSRVTAAVRAGDKGSHFRRLGPEPVIHQREPRSTETQ